MFEDHEAAAEKIVVRCLKCGVSLTPVLDRLTDETRLTSEESRDYLPRGCFVISDGIVWPVGTVVCNLNDLIHASNHPDRHRLNGCCGMDGLNGINKVCCEGHEVGTEKSDCWMPHG